MFKKKNIIKLIIIIAMSDLTMDINFSLIIKNNVNIENNMIMCNIKDIEIDMYNTRNSENVITKITNREKVTNVLNKFNSEQMGYYNISNNPINVHITACTKNNCDLYYKTYVKSLVNCLVDNDDVILSFINDLIVKPDEGEVVNDKNMNLGSVGIVIATISNFITADNKDNKIENFGKVAAIARAGKAIGTIARATGKAAGAVKSKASTMDYIVPTVFSVVAGAFYSLSNIFTGE